MTSFVWLLVAVVAVVLVIAAISDELRGGGLKEIWANRAKAWRRIRRSAGTTAYFLLAVYGISGVVDPTNPRHSMPWWWYPISSVAFLMWGVRRVVEDVVNSSKVVISIEGQGVGFDDEEILRAVKRIDRREGGRR